MTAKISAMILLIFIIPMFAWAQGGTCTQYDTWGLSGGAGADAKPVYWPADYVVEEMQQFQAQYGGVGPFCSAQWAGVPGVWGGWSGFCHSIAWSCKPLAPPVGGCSTCNTAGEPIDLATGNTFIKQTDVSLPGLGGGLALTRTWSTGVHRWATNYEEQIFPGGDGMVRYVRSDGSMWAFAYYGNPATYHLVAPGNGQATLTELFQQSAPYTPTGWQVTFQNGEQRRFILMPSFLDQYNHYQNNGGFLSEIKDRNGNTTFLTYTIDNQGNLTFPLLSVTDAAGRHLYFTYNSGQLASVTSDTGSGINVSYTYDFSLSGFPQLTRVTQADNTFVTLSYDFLGNVLSVNDQNGKVLESHTYDATGRGLSSSRANGVESLTVTYP
jgi:YD repeat-containing protein